MCELLSNISLFVGQLYADKSLALHARDLLCFTTDLQTVIYTEQKKKRNNRPPRIFEFKRKTLIISGLLPYDSHLWDIRVYHAKN